MSDKTFIGRGTHSSFMRISAIHGEFTVLGSPITVRYASTYAEGTGDSSHTELLEELRPIREVRDSASISNLTSLLQRDLNDTRVAEELIPYLSGKTHEGFFPPIVVVLMPKGYLEQGSSEGEDVGSSPADEKNENNGDKQVAYPDAGKEEEIDVGRRIDYDGYWRYTRYYDPTDPESSLSVGDLEIAKSKCDLVVLDGQHRALAFKYMNGLFDPTGTTYMPLYRNAPPVPSKKLAAQLPVMIVWFESETEIVEPAMISRKLFVDVNNSARPVSEARTILLDDRDPVRIAAQEVYQMSAKNRFASKRFSLLHGAFDADSGGVSGPSVHRFAITYPEAVAEACEWLLLRAKTYEALDRWEVQRRGSQRHTNRFYTTFGDDLKLVGNPDSDEEGNRLVLRTRDDAESYRRRFRERIVPGFETLLNEWNVYKQHYEAGKQLETVWLPKQGANIHEAWTKVFCGGEGLYWTLKGEPGGVGIAIKEVNERMLTEQKEAFERSGAKGVTESEISSLFRSITSKAFITGAIAAIDYYRSENKTKDLRDAADEVVTKWNSLTLSQWIAIINDFREELTKKMEATDWPALRNLLYRAALPAGDFYTSYEETPEWRILSLELVRRGKEHARVHRKPADPLVAKEIVASEWKRIMTIQKACGFKLPSKTTSKIKKQGVDEFITAVGGEIATLKKKGYI
jgi:hypothetical protein